MKKTIITTAVLAALGFGGSALADEIITRSVGESKPVATMPADITPELNYTANETPAPEVLTSDASGVAPTVPDYALSGNAAVGTSKLEECTPGSQYKGFVISPDNPDVIEEVDFVCPTPVVRKAVKRCDDVCVDTGLLNILGIGSDDYKSGACSRGSKCVDTDAARRGDGLVVKVELLDGRVTKLETAQDRTNSVLIKINQENTTMNESITYLKTITERLDSAPKLSELAAFGSEVRAGKCKDEFEHLNLLEGNYHTALKEVNVAQESMFGLREKIQTYLGGKALDGEKLDLNSVPLKGPLKVIQNGMDKVDLTNSTDATLTGMIKSYRQAQRSVTAAVGRVAISADAVLAYRTELLEKGNCKDEHTRVETDIGINAVLYTGDVSAGGEVVAEVLAFPDNGKFGIGGSVIVPTGQGPTSRNTYNERVGAMERSVDERSQVLPRAIPGIKIAGYLADRFRAYATVGMSIFQNEHSEKSDINGDVKTIKETTTGVGLDVRGGLDYKIPLGDKAGLRINAEGGYDTGFGGVFTGGMRVTF